MSATEASENINLLWHQKLGGDLEKVKSSTKGY
jgi:hypothetical protein